MLKILFFTFINFLFFCTSYSQTNPSDKHIMDSLLKNDPMLKMINDLGKPTSYIRLNMGIGNKLYSNQNKSIESLQNNNQFVMSPSIGYYHKSGFGISFTGFLLNENKKTNFYQYTLTPSFNYTKGKVADAAISYTHYFERDPYGTNTSPIQNEIYTTLLFKNSWLKPGIAAGYSSGKFFEIINVDTSGSLLGRLFRIKYIDTAVIKLSSFSASASIEHSFIFFNLFSIKDGLVFTPQLSLISAINHYTVKHNSSIENYNSFTKIHLKRIRHFQSQSDNNKYQLQSAGLDCDVNYTIGKFYVEPEIYFDYYLPNTTDTRFTQMYNLNIGITF